MNTTKIIEFDVDCLIKEVRGGENLDFEFLEGNTGGHKGKAFESLHYPWGVHVPLNDNDKYNIDDVQAEIERAKQLLISTINVEVEFRKMLSDDKVTVYFSPANMFSYTNTEAKSIYAFGYVDLKENRLEIQIESNFIVL